MKARASTTAVGASTPARVVRSCSSSGWAREAAHALDEGEQLWPLVPSQRLTEQGAELSHRGSQGGVLPRRGDTAREHRLVGLTAIGLEELLGRGPVGRGHGHSRTVSRFRPRFPSHHRDGRA